MITLTFEPPRYEHFQKKTDTVLLHRYFRGAFLHAHKGQRRRQGHGVNYWPLWAISKKEQRQREREEKARAV